MTSTPARATGAPQDSNFTRNATGLVREVSMWDALIMHTLGMNVAVGAVLLLQQAPAIFPGGDLVLLVLIGPVMRARTRLPPGKIAGACWSSSTAPTATF